MSMTGYMCERLEKAVAELAEGAIGHIHGISIAEILQQAATKMMKQCHDGEGEAGYQECLEILDEARRGFVEDAKERNRQWHERFAKEAPAPDADFSDGSDHIPF
jgi:hypothetical protein